MKLHHRARAGRLPVTRPKNRGAALLLAMVVLTLVATAAAGMVWQQQRAIHVEAAERVRAQAGWLLDGVIDFGRYVLRERFGGNTGGGSGGLAPWDIELKESSVSSLLAADRANNADVDLDVFVSGRIEDAHARYNLWNLVNQETGEPIEAERPTLDEMCRLAGAQAFAPAIVAALSAARKTPVQGPVLDSVPATTPVITRVEHLRWLGIDEATLARLMQLVDMLPGKTTTKLNLNTASAEVIEAVLLGGPGIPTGIGQRLARVNLPSSARFATLDQARIAGGLPADTALPATRVEVANDQFSFFYLVAAVRFEDRALAARALVERDGIGRNAPVHIRRLDRGPVPPGMIGPAGIAPGFVPGRGGGMAPSVAYGAQGSNGTR